MSSAFNVSAKKGLARAGELTTAHGVIQTPVFMPIATAGAIKTMTAEETKALGAQVILGNTYHLLLRPGEADMKTFGGLHKFMNWNGPILTDSGGYQVFSLAKLNKTDEDGVTFQSHIDGHTIRLTAEDSMRIQAAIGSDIRMQFDDVAAGLSTRERYEEAMERSLRWAERSKGAFTGGSTHGSTPTPLLFGIIQGGTFEDLRARSLEGLTKTGFDGYAIGGLSVGEHREDTFRIVKNLASKMPDDKPRYFMGGGMPEEIMYYVAHGVDMFDCVIPTRHARHGQIFVWKGNPAECVAEAFARAQDDSADFRIAEAMYEKVAITNEQFTTDQSPIDAFNDCPTSNTYTKAYLRHLFKNGEMLGMKLATAQNLRFYIRMMEEIRKVIGSPS